LSAAHAAHLEPGLSFGPRMTVSFICVFLAFGLCYAPKIMFAVAAALGEPASAKSAPKGQRDRRGRKARQDDERFEGWRARALTAHRDALETFAPFAAAVVIAHLAGLDAYRSGLLAATFVMARTFHLAASLANLDYLRLAAWGVGLVSTAALYVLPWLV
jgi:uncharacterized MAPEG superfamily protein